MRKNDLIIGMGLSIVCYLIAPDVFDKFETVCFQTGMVIFGSLASKIVREALEEIMIKREQLEIGRSRRHTEKQINFPHKKRYYILPITERIHD